MLPWKYNHWLLRYFSRIGIENIKEERCRLLFLNGLRFFQLNFLEQLLLSVCLSNKREKYSKNVFKIVIMIISFLF